MQVDDALLTRLEKLSFLKVSDDKREEMVDVDADVDTYNSIKQKNLSNTEVFH